MTHPKDYIDQAEQELGRTLTDAEQRKLARCLLHGDSIESAVSELRQSKLEVTVLRLDEIPAGKGWRLANSSPLSNKWVRRGRG